MNVIKNKRYKSSLSFDHVHIFKTKSYIATDLDENERKI
jgi:hypothetical protein